MVPFTGFALPLFLLLAQGASPAKDDDPKVAEELDSLAKSVKAKDDDTAIAAIDRLTVASRTAGPKDRGRIAKGVGATFQATRVPQQGQRSEEAFRVYTAAAASLGTMGEEGAKPLLAAVDLRKFRNFIELRCSLIAALGSTKASSAVKPLLDLFDSKDYPVIAAAADTLSNYKGAKEAERKKIVEEMVRHLESASGQAAQDPNDTEAKRKYDAIGGPLMNSLSKLTGEEIRDPLGWVKWWNNNKKKAW